MDKLSLTRKLQSYLEALNLSLSMEQIETLINYLLLLQEWNETYNLTSVVEVDEMLPVHIMDSLSILPHIHGTKLIDVGTGAGLPGIPLAVALPEVHFTLLDSNGKKTRFLKQAKYNLGIDNIDVVHSRVEKFVPEQPFDTVVSRAFSSIEKFAATTQHLIASNGRWLIMKGKHLDDELSQLSDSLGVASVDELKVPGLARARYLVSLSTGS